MKRAVRWTSVSLSLFVAAVLTSGLVARPNAQGNPSATQISVETVNKWMTELSNWGRWGKDDGIGTLNLITPDKRKKALALVKEGVAVSLAHTIDKNQAPDNPRPLGQQMTLDTGGHAMDLYTIWYHGS